MPTGYTNDIAKGISFQEFALQCARAFGACITQRDDHLSSKIVLDEVGSFYRERQVAAEKHAAELAAMTIDQIIADHAAEQANNIKNARDEIEKKRDLRAKYEAMLLEVDAWEPPTDDHRGMKEFMDRQIRESIDWDCNTEYYEERIANAGKQSDPLKWHQERLVQAGEEMSRSDLWLQEEIDRVNGRNEWKRQLAKSLGIEIKGGE